MGSPEQPNLLKRQSIFSHLVFAPKTITLEPKSVSEATFYVRIPGMNKGAIRPLVFVNPVEHNAVMACALEVKPKDEATRVPPGQFGLVKLGNPQEKVTISLGRSGSNPRLSIAISTQEGKWIAQYGDDSQNSVEINAERLVAIGSSAWKIGTKDHASIILPQELMTEGVSRQHCTLSVVTRQGQVYLLVEDVSTMGTWITINDVPKKADVATHAQAASDGHEGKRDSDTEIRKHGVPFQGKHTFFETGPKESFLPPSMRYYDEPSIPLAEREKSNFSIGGASQPKQHQSPDYINEDFYITDSQERFAIVCDGVGSTTQAALASETVAKKIAEMLSSTPENASPREMEARLADALTEAQKTVRKEAPEGGTTVVVAKELVLENGKKVLVHASSGDSRIAILRKGKLIPLTRDHSLLRVALETQAIDQDEYDRISQLLNTTTDPSALDPVAADYFKERRVIYGGLGEESGLVFDTGVFVLEEGDIAVLTTDGIHDTLTTGNIISTLATQEDPSKQAQALVDAVTQITDNPARNWDAVFSPSQRGKPDDRTAVVMRT